MSKASEFRQFLREFKATCPECGASYRLKLSEVHIVNASRGEATYQISCSSCGRSGIGFMGSPDFLERTYAHFEGFCLGRGLPPLDVQVDVTSLGPRPFQ